MLRLAAPRGCTSSCTWRMSRLVEPPSSSARSRRTSADLEDVGGEALDAGVHRLALAGLADAEVRATTARGSGGAGRTASRCSRARGPRSPCGPCTSFTVGERHEVGVEDLGRLLGRDVEALRQAVGLHAVGQPVRRPSSPWPAARRSTVVGSTPNTRAAVAVWMSLPRVERLDQARVLGQVGDAAQLDLVVVGDQQLVARRRARTPGGTARPSSRADRDVVQVRRVGATAGRCGRRSG